mgnify:CR=1 FL=1
MVWDSSISKANISEDKAAGNKQSITVHRMTVNKNEGDENHGNNEEDS